MLAELFTYKGRFNRLRYFGYSFLISFSTYLLAFLVGILAGLLTPLSFILFVPLIIGAMILYCFNVIKRLHDIGLSGWFSLPVPILTALFEITDYSFLINIISLAYFLPLLFWPGQKFDNKYGEVKYAEIQAE